MGSCKAATAIVDLVLGLAISSLLTGVATRAVRQVRQYTETGGPVARGRVRTVQTEQEYAPDDPRFTLRQRVYGETRPLTDPQDRDPGYHR